jgi:hypothetical protein
MYKSRTSGDRPSKAEWFRISDFHSLDVVLSRSRRLGSKITASIAGGKFSHASVVMDEHFWFDAEPAGCGMFTPFVNSEPDNGQWYVKARSLGQIRVLRHPVIGLLSNNRKEALLESARQYCNDLTGATYSPYERLIPLIRSPAMRQALTKWPGGIKKLSRVLDRLHSIFLADHQLRPVLAWERTLIGHKSASAYFCSELIVEIFHAVGLGLVRDGSPAESFAPDDLYDARRSLLTPVESPRFRLQSHLLNRVSGDYELISQSERALISGAEELKRLEISSRKGLNMERLHRYLTKAAYGPIPGLGEKILSIEDGMLALMHDLKALLHLVRNLHDLQTCAIPQLGVPKRKHLFEWCCAVKGQLALGHLTPRTKKAASIALREINLDINANSAPAEKLFKTYKKLIHDIATSHNAATRLNQQLLDSMSSSSEGQS